ncbi:MAG: hypothetical protein ABSC65_11200 [Acidobacteriaceae bacterium]|jgi:hypothetical protein
MHQVVLPNKGRVQKKGVDASGVDHEKSWDTVNARFANHGVLLKVDGNGRIFAWRVEVPWIVESNQLVVEVNPDGQTLQPLIPNEREVILLAGRSIYDREDLVVQSDSADLDVVDHCALGGH